MCLDTQPLLSVFIGLVLNMYNIQNTGKELLNTVSLQNNDHQLLSHLYENYAPALYGFISRMISNEKLAEETLVNTFVKIWNRIGEFNFSNPGMFNQVLKIGRQTVFETIKNREESVLTANFKSDTAANSDENDRVFNLVYYKGYTLSDVASALQIPIENARTLLKTSVRGLNRINKVV